ncbi:hypothetical protein DFH08DRAFT_817401 [Mycena albidolilacea]|uniref:Uncharacterized protein n=1 Tax=Mycena albidolilacea TaxID=1033008 RepID=A0AAD7EIE0_9AGAR|nr:hypothetical protein DFH08DRAFT_817401 [Mycena albidolilacea]
MAEADIAPAKSRPRSRKKPTESSASLPPEIDSAGRTRAATRILVNLPKSTASAPAGMNESIRDAEIPELGDTRATTADGGPLPIPFSHNVSESGSGLPALQTVSNSSLSGVESETSETEYISPQELVSRTHLLANAARQASALGADLRDGGVDSVFLLGCQSRPFHRGHRPNG